MILERERLSPTPTALRAAEDELLQGTGGKAVVWCGRGATALYLAYRAAREFGPPRDVAEVVVPSIACGTLASAAILAGLRPRFADVDAETGLISLDTIRACHTKNTRAVVFVHLYGQTADLTGLASWCKNHDILLIEDNAQALGGRLSNGRPVGSLGDMSVYSFNRTKILECGGGALLLRQREMAADIERDLRIHPLPAEPDSEIASQLSQSYRNLHHALAGLLRVDPSIRIAPLFLGVRHAYDRLYLRTMDNPGALERAWGELPRRLTERYHHAGQYHANLIGGPWTLLDGWQQSGVCWRFSLLVDFPDCLVPFSDAVRHDGFHLSNLYWPIHLYFGPSDSCPVAERFARRVVNLWVDGNVDADRIDACVVSLRRHADHFGQTNDN